MIAGDFLVVDLFVEDGESFLLASVEQISLFGFGVLGGFLEGFLGLDECLDCLIA